MNSRRKFYKAYKTARGKCYVGKIEDAFNSTVFNDIVGKVDLILTSPPFPLKRKKNYGNLDGDEYLYWLSDLATKFKKLLKPRGSIVIEIGNAWESRRPIMSTIPLRALLKFLEAGQYNLCQQFIWFNNARLPGPAQWVNIDRVRVKDAFTHIWWMSKSERPKADNRRVLTEYSKSMNKLLKSKKYNAGLRPSEHYIREKSFLVDNNGAIPPNVIIAANTASSSAYYDYCRENDLPVHPARMPAVVAEFFIRFLTTEGDLILDPFAGSNTTGEAAEKLRRRWISVEARVDYVNGSKGKFR
jgi:DNA modification methylase